MRPTVFSYCTETELQVLEEIITIKFHERYALFFGMVFYGMVWYGMVSYGIVWYDMIWYGIFIYSIHNNIFAIIIIIILLFI